MSTDQPMHFLVVDDNEHDFRVISRHLRSEFGEASVVHADNGRDGLELLSVEEGIDRWDCIFLDYMLPDMSGINFLEQIGKHDKRLAGRQTKQVIMLTGHGDEMLSVQAIRAGAYDYLPKNAINRKLLGDTVRRLYEHVQLENRLDEERKLREKAEQALRESEINEAQLAAIRAAIGTCMHEISNPLTGIIGLLQLKLEDNPEDEDLQLMFSAAMRIRELTVRLDSIKKVRFSTVDMAGTSDSDVEESSSSQKGSGTLERGGRFLQLPELSPDD